MAKTKISEFSTTAGNNTDINSINIAEGCAPSGINDAIRELMRQLKEFQTGGAGDSVNSGGDFSVATNKFTVASATGNTAVAGTLGATGDFAVNTNKFTVTAASGNTSVAGTLGAAGNFAVNTDKFTVAASTGNTAVAGTFAVTGATTLTGALVANGNSTLGDADTDTVTLNASFVTGTTLKTAKTATNTLALAAYDVDGTAYTNLVTLTAGNTPSLALTSTAVGTINNMSIGATTASTGAFTTLSASSDVTLSGGTANGVLYLNGSKVATSGSALYFNGTNLGINTSSPTQKLDVDGNIRTTGEVALSGSDFVYSWAGGTTGQRRSGFYLDGVNNVLRMYTNAAEVARIDSGGRLLLNRTSNNNNETLQISGNSGYWTTALFANTTSNNSYGLYVSAGTSSSDRALRIQNAAASSDLLILDGAGNLLVGTTSLTGPIVSGGSGVVLRAAGQIYANDTYLNVNADGTIMQFRRSGTAVGSISVTTTATAYNTSSDQRLKENIVNAPEFGSVIDAIQVRSFDWKTDQTHQRAGFIAQELVSVAPEAVYQPDDSDEMMAVDYSKLVPMLVKEIQSLRARVAALES